MHRHIEVLLAITLIIRQYRLIIIMHIHWVHELLHRHIDTGIQGAKHGAR